MLKQCSHIQELCLWFLTLPRRTCAFWYLYFSITMFVQVLCLLFSWSNLCDKVRWHLVWSRSVRVTLGPAAVCCQPWTPGALSEISPLCSGAFTYGTAGSGFSAAQLMGNWKHWGKREQCKSFTAIREQITHSPCEFLMSEKFPVHTLHDFQGCWALMLPFVSSRESSH